eukprot:TRINITY_DN8568_c0_g4_i1.p1 TRINITY_DN8568_c0_g4~~TRINITY_DN8568_c0_g4_i1.p1  ORF type:complete len:605 (+),score=108.57 TRINITY_DN8568_c0_g4_i1:135-1949(+)
MMYNLSAAGIGNEAVRMKLHDFQNRTANTPASIQTRDQNVWYDETVSYVPPCILLPETSIHCARQRLTSQKLRTGNLFDAIVCLDDSVDKLKTYAEGLFSESDAFSEAWAVLLIGFANYLSPGTKCHTEADASSRLGNGVLIQVMQLLSRLQPSVDSRDGTTNLKRHEIRWSHAQPGKDLRGAITPIQSQWKMFSTEAKAKTFVELHDVQRAICDLAVRVAGLAKYYDPQRVPIAYDVVCIYDNDMQVFYYALLRCLPVYDADNAGAVLGFKVEKLFHSAIPLIKEGPGVARVYNATLKGLNVRVAAGPAEAMVSVGQLLGVLAELAKQTKLTLADMSIKVAPHFPAVALAYPLSTSVSVSKSQRVLNPKWFAVAKSHAVACGISLTSAYTAHGSQTRFWDAQCGQFPGVNGVCVAKVAPLNDCQHLINSLAVHIRVSGSAVSSDVEICAVQPAVDFCSLIQWMPKFTMCDQLGTPALQQQFVRLLPVFLLELVRLKVAMVDVHGSNIGMDGTKLILTDRDGAVIYDDENNITVDERRFHSTYAAPELKAGAAFTLQADVFGFGSMLLNQCAQVLSAEQQRIAQQAVVPDPALRPTMAAFIAAL